MRALAAALVLVSAAACTDGGQRPQPTAVPTPTPAPATPSTPGGLGGMFAYVSIRGVRLVTADGAVRAITDGPVEEVESLAWTGDGRYVAWNHDGGNAPAGITVYEAATGRTATWSAPEGALLEEIAGTAGGFVAVAENTPQLYVLDAAAVLAGQQARIVKLPLKNAHLVAANARRVLVGTSTRRSAVGGPDVVYEVSSRGRLTRLFQDGDLGPGHTAPWVFPLRLSVLSQDGERLTYIAGQHAKPCTPFSRFVVVREVGVRREPLQPEPPPDPAPLTLTTSVHAGPDGRALVAFEHRTDCDREGRHAVYSLDRTTWTKVADDAQWAAPGPAGKVAVIRPDDRLDIDGGHVDDNVEEAAWAPVPG